MPKKNTNFSSSSFQYIGEELKKTLDDISNEISNNVEIGLDEASDFLVRKFEDATPSLTGETKRSWERSNKYKRVRYINNTALTKDNIPKINILEYSTSHGKPFVRDTFDKSQNDIEGILIKNLNQEKQ